MALRKIANSHGQLPWSGTSEFDIRFPCLDTGPLVPRDVTSALAHRAPHIFAPGALDGVLPPERLVDGRPAIVSKVLHGASLTVDHEGATAKAVTAVVTVGLARLRHVHCLFAHHMRLPSLTGELSQRRKCLFGAHSAAL